MISKPTRPRRGGEILELRAGDMAHHTRVEMMGKMRMLNRMLPMNQNHE